MTPGQDWESWYRALRLANPEAYRNTINSIEAVTLTFNIAIRPAAEYERAAVMAVCAALGVKP